MSINNKPIFLLQPVTFKKKREFLFEGLRSQLFSVKKLSG